MNTSLLIKYIIDEYFDKDPKKMAGVTGYTSAQISSWLKKEVTPQKGTIIYIFNCIFTPEFKIIAEFKEFDPNEHVKPQLQTILGGHEKDSGLYAFYDSMANLLYLGKATHLLQESYESIRRPVVINFPKSVKNKPEKLYEAVKYISYYQVQQFDYIDYPKHVESLLLRISKPILNKNIGSLEEAYLKHE